MTSSADYDEAVRVEVGACPKSFIVGLSMLQATTDWLVLRYLGISREPRRRY